MKRIFFPLVALFIMLLISFNSHTSNKNLVLNEGEIINLYDAFSKDQHLRLDFGFSCITKYKGKTILFDSGSNADIFKENTQKLGIDLKSVDMVVISHGHFDHLNGLDYLLKINPDVQIYFPYDIYWGAPTPLNVTGQESDISAVLPTHMKYFNGEKTRFTIEQSGRFWGANITFIDKNTEIEPGIRLIATKSTYLGYFSCYPGKNIVEAQSDAHELDCNRNGLPELSLALSTEKGAILFVGCSHAGVENIVSASLDFTKNNIHLLLGGFHMLPFNRSELTERIELLKSDYQVKQVAPAHCTGHLAFKMLYDSYGENYHYLGLGEKISY